MRIPKPKQQAGPHMAQWFYALCTCGKLVEVTGGIIPEHSYTMVAMYGVGPFTYRCDQSLTPHSNRP